MRRGDTVSVVTQGDFGKPRPALILQANQFAAHSSVTVALITSLMVDAPLLRVSVTPTAKNGLQKPSQIMIDKTMTVKRDKIGAILGRIEAADLVVVERCLAIFLGIAK